MRGTGIFHPLFATHPSYGLETSMTDEVEIYKPTGKPSTWSPAEGMSEDSFELVYVGPARVQPGLDGTARNRNFANELTASESMRVQLPYGANGLPGTDGELPEILKDYRVVVVGTGGPQERNAFLVGNTMIVRNAEQASQKWLRTFLCDTGTRQRNG